MCGIVGAVARRNITPILIEGGCVAWSIVAMTLQASRYVMHRGGHIQRIRSVGKVASLQERMADNPH